MVMIMSNTALLSLIGTVLNVYKSIFSVWVEARVARGFKFTSRARNREVGGTSM